MMANHLNYDLLSKLAEHRASALDEARAERHLESCGRCRSELEWLQRIRVGPRQDPELGSSGPSMRDWLLPSTF
jgi:anti-sigma factor RsiW